MDFLLHIIFIIFLLWKFTQNVLIILLNLLFFCSVEVLPLLITISLIWAAFYPDHILIIFMKIDSAPLRRIFLFLVDHVEFAEIISSILLLSYRNPSSCNHCCR